MWHTEKYNTTGTWSACRDLPPKKKMFTCSLGLEEGRHRVYSHLGTLGPRRRIRERSVHTDPPLCCLDSSTHKHTEDSCYICEDTTLQSLTIQDSNPNMQAINFLSFSTQQEFFLSLCGFKYWIWVWEYNAGGWNQLTDGEIKAEAPYPESFSSLKK